MTSSALKNSLSISQEKHSCIIGYETLLWIHTLYQHRLLLKVKCGCNSIMVWKWEVFSWNFPHHNRRTFTQPFLIQGAIEYMVDTFTIFTPTNFFKVTFARSKTVFTSVGGISTVTILVNERTWQQSMNISHRGKKLN